LWSCSTRVGPKSRRTRVPNCVIPGIDLQFPWLHQRLSLNERAMLRGVDEKWTLFVYKNTEVDIKHRLCR
jgi:hypothetical protein